MRSLSRRDFCGAVTVSAALGLPVLRPRVARAQSQRDLIRRGDVHVRTISGRNVVALAAADGALLVDGGPASEAAAILDWASTLPSAGTVRTLFNTCWHPEHTGLNATLGEAGATIIAHENTRLWLTAEVTWPWNGQRFSPLPEVARPNKTFYHREQLSVGGEQVEYGHVRACPHTDGDAYVFFPKANVLAVGDAVSSQGWPFIDWWTGGWIGGIVGGLETLLSVANAETLIVPGRGPLLSYAELKAQHQMYDVIYERLATLLYSGRGPDEAVAALPTQEFDAKMGQSDEFVRVAFRSLWGYLAPDA